MSYKKTTCLRCGKPCLANNTSGLCRECWRNSRKNLPHASTPCIKCGAITKSTLCRTCFKQQATLEHIERITNEFGKPAQEVIHSLYYEEKQSAYHSAKQLSITVVRFRAIMKYFGFKMRTRSEAVYLQWFHDDGTRVKNTSQRMLEMSRTRNMKGENNPAKRPEVREKISKAKKAHNPGLIIGRNKLFQMRRERIPNSIERAMMKALDRAKIKYVREYRIWKYQLDFALVPCKVAIECDGIFWHDPGKDAIRDMKLEGFGWLTFRYTGDQIREDVDACIQDLLTRLDELGITPPRKR